MSPDLALLDSSLQAKRERALAALRGGVPGGGRLAVAFSGGVDSTLLLALAADALGPARVIAATARSESLAADELAECQALAGRLGLTLRLLETHELQRAGYRENSPERCYHCKTELFRHLLPLARQEGFAHVAYGLIADDLRDFRPGQRAAVEAGVLRPLADVGMTKDDVRARSRVLGLPTADLPASPCLASRLPYGTPVTGEAMRRVEAAEAAVRALGFRELRVRHLGEAARVEIARDELERLAEPGVREAVEAGVRRAGFLQVEIDPEGYRRGRLNEALRVVPVTTGV